MDQDSALAKWKLILCNGYCTLINHNVFNVLIYSLLIIFETLQWLFFAAIFPQTMHESYGYLRDFFKAFLYVPYFEDMFGETGFILIWSIHMLLLIANYVLIVVVFYLFQSTNTRAGMVARPIIKLCAILLVLHKTVFTFPAAYVFSVPIVCSSYGCWYGTYIVLGVFSVLGLLFLVIAIKAAELYTDYYLNSEIPWAKPDSRATLFRPLVKIALSFYFALDMEMQAAWYCYILLIFSMLYLCYQQYVGLSYFNWIINAIENARIFMLTLTVIFAYLCRICKSEIDLGVGIFLLLSTFGISTVISAFQHRSRYDTLERDIIHSSSENNAINGMILLQMEMENIIKKFISRKECKKILNSFSNFFKVKEQKNKIDQNPKQKQMFFSEKIYENE